MAFSRRHLLHLMAAFPAALGISRISEAETLSPSSLEDWEAVRDLFELTRDKVHMSAMLLSSHPRPVAQAIARHRAGLDRDTVAYLEAHMEELTEASRRAAGTYLDIHSSHVAFADSTTMAVGLAYGGLQIRADQEMLTTDEDYFVTHEALRLKALESGARLRSIPLYERASDATAEAIAAAVLNGVGPKTRLVALTWVHSSTGLKMPIRAIARGLRDHNAGRDPQDHILLGVDGVHGFGIEDVSFADLGCDMLMAGCHKWLFGPRGTGIAVFSGKALDALAPTVPSFTDDPTFNAWVRRRNAPRGRNNGRRMTPGGFKAFEHLWAVKEAFELHAQIGKAAVQERTHGLATRLKRGLAAIDGVAVITPMDPDLSAGIVSFDIDGRSAGAAVAALRERGIVASVAPYAQAHIRLTPSIRNMESEVDTAIEAVKALA
ncbi:aminotransferase class V-fold PLP-dependent enzyme [Stappia sp. WLB 29]|uniref:aminotransferase class V-fold PLP-dependent enzyme n=1 Tax=Stappia sp. WLB 29 TaxID=2925220 RepID=UPI0020BE2BB7|nr:aminotransferase class V-fold PLP-dependent enzyme [Stappia sp. WLB 29]